MSVGYDIREKSSYLLNNKRESNFVSWFGYRPIVSFGSDDINLVYGPPELRRKYLDLICSQIDNDYLKVLFEYKYWINSRNTLLNSTFNGLQCDIYDEKIADLGSYLIIKRAEIIDKSRQDFISIFKKIAGNDLVVEILYESLFYGVNYSKTDSKNVFLTHLKECRKKDLCLGYTSLGPHRENIKLLINSHNAKSFSSQGQCRALSLSFKLSMSNLLYKESKEKIIFLIDDTVSELDSEKTKNFFSFIENKGQVFIAIPQGKSSFIKSFHTISF